MKETPCDYNMLHEGDVLLFRNPGFPSLGWGICKYTRGIHSHVGIASKVDGDWMIIEQREFRGGREVRLDSQVNKKGIDVYRICSYITTPDDMSHSFTKEVARRVCRTARSLTGIRYGWKNIWTIFKAYAPFIRLIQDNKSKDDVTDAFVCSTVVSYAYRKNFIDLCPNLDDTRTSPADIARCGLLRYVCTLKR
jgi:hypothetical protein